jgi:AAA+ ATPase superfamily predicted ATPase
MSHDRKIKWLHDRRVITRCNPWSDKPSQETDLYMYYNNGTHQCYTLFASKAKITTYKSLKWHFLVIQFLNENESNSFLESIFKFIADKENGFVTFFIKSKVLDKMIQDVFDQGSDPPVNKIRKVIFKPAAWPLSLSDKLSIVGKLIGRNKLDKSMLYQCMLDINDEGQKITTKKLAELLNVTQRTIYRHMCDTLRKEKQILNEEL